MKYCSSCKKQKPLITFNKKSASKDGLQAQCKSCQNNYAKNYQQIHKIKIARYQKEYQEKYKQTFIGYLHRCFSDIKQRCENLKHSRYKDWGGRGIRCLFGSANDFINYIIVDLGYDTLEKIKGLYLDRIDNNGHYEIGNIRFVTPKISANNRRKRRSNA